MAPVMTGRRRNLAIGLALVLGAWATGIGSAWADTSPGPTIPTPKGDAPTHCPAEQYPHAGTPRNGPFVPYEIPFTATLGQTDPVGLHIGGYLQIANGPVTVTLGGPIQTDLTTGQTYGSVFASACGVVQLPSEAGQIPGNPYGMGNDPVYNNNFAFDNPIDVSLSLTGFPGLPAILSAYGAADGQMAAQIANKPAPNGGLQVSFQANAKSTSDFGPAFSSLVGQGLPVGLPASVVSLLTQVSNTAGNSCTVTLGNEIADGTPAVDVQNGVTKLPMAVATSPVPFTTGTSGNISGRPVTGPITKANATLVANNFSIGAIDPSTAPAPQDPGAKCTASSAALLNQLLGLPSIPDPAKGHYPNTFYAPGTFAVYTSS